MKARPLLTNIFFFKTGIKIIPAVLCAIIFTLSGCSSDEQFPDPGPPKPPEEIGKAQVWITTGNQSKLLSKEADVPITKIAETDFPTVTLNPLEKLQEIEGFGAALTGSSAYLINRKMSVAQRQSLLDDLFDPGKGIGITYLRMTIGASDFSLSDYTYDD